jgi:hypothetical protein
LLFSKNPDLRFDGSAEKTGTRSRRAQQENAKQGIIDASKKIDTHRTAFNEQQRSYSA